MFSSTSNRCKMAKAKREIDQIIQAEKDLLYLSPKAFDVYSNQDMYKFSSVGENEYFCKYDGQIYTLENIEELMLSL